MTSTGRVAHRGVTIARRGRRWRWQVREEGLPVTRSFETLAEAECALDDFLAARARKRHLDALIRSGSLTVAELCERWLLLKKARLAPATVQSYDQMIRVHIGPRIGHLDANTLRPKDLDAFYSSRRYKAARNSHVVLRQAFSWGLQNGELLRESNPALSVCPDRKACVDYTGEYAFHGVHAVAEKDVPRSDEIEKLLADAQQRGDRRWWLYLVLATTTGARPGEVCALRRRDVDTIAFTVSIRWNADRVGGTIRPPKRKHSVRTLRMAGELFTLITDHLPDDPDAFLFPSGGYRGRTSPLPCWNSRSVKRRLDDALRRTGLPHYTPHSFRHYVATRLLVATKDTVQVARFLGHANDSLVRSLYANHLHDGAQRELGRLASVVPLRAPGFG